MAIINLLSEERRLTVDRRGVNHIALAKNPEIGLSEVLRALDLRIDFIDFLTQFSTNGMDRGGAEISRVP